MSNNRSLFIPGEYYHIYNHAVGYDNLFTEERNYQFFIEKFKKHALPVFRCYAYVLMPNHFHFFVSVRTETELLFHAGDKIDPNEVITFSYHVSQQWSNFLNAYAKAFNKANHRAGALFRQSTPRKILNGNDHITALINYIHFNPVKHGFTRNSEDWKHSSIHELINLQESTFLERDWIIE